MLKGLENVTYKKRLIERGLFSIKMSELRSCCRLKLCSGSVQRG